ncbi:hypothetical protein CPT_Seuss29 [Caulobacter phage Seuss]|uniref:Uncharacterized protein n=1 Tax=Caulobacter phage Seuss TaxID=1675601 RepID=A0A0K1LN42_9CAUD|nr:hypothetical protein HOR08_gp029 [Caulobacter phage Seuss]AKU43555.1 hypothetical protein CPT_Seuss29 [Caulobacter phage Seuss]
MSRTLIFYTPEGTIVGKTSYPDAPGYFERQTHPMTSLKMEIHSSLSATIELYEVDTSTQPHQLRRKP